ncbi:MAG: hypothetical protein ACT4PT_02710, partial [Methanobacteriota archaeon]
MRPASVIIAVLLAPALAGRLDAGPASADGAAEPGALRLTCPTPCPRVIDDSPLRAWEPMVA